MLPSSCECQSEYEAAATALSFARATLGPVNLLVLMDSELVVKQLEGIYQTKEAHLKTLAESVKALKKEHTKVVFAAIRRDYNSRADVLSNEAVEKFSGGDERVFEDDEISGEERLELPKDITTDNPQARFAIYAVKRQLRAKLWQSLVDDFSQWWDNRNNKPNPKGPDFTHKESREGLWLDSCPEELLAQVTGL